MASLYLMLRANFDRLVAAADGRRHDPLVRQELAARHIDTVILRLLALRTISAAANDQMPGAEGSVVKLAWSGAEQRMALAADSVIGIGALEDPWAGRVLGSRSLTIAGGTTEVNKNIIGERVLGLPREPRPTEPRT